MSNASYSTELSKLLRQLEELDQLNKGYQDKLSATENDLKEKDIKVTSLLSTIDENTSSLEELRALNTRFEQENQKLLSELKEKVYLKACIYCYRAYIMYCRILA